MNQPLKTVIQGAKFLNQVVKDVNQALKMLIQPLKTLNQVLKKLIQRTKNARENRTAIGKTIIIQIGYRRVLNQALRPPQGRHRLQTGAEKSLPPEGVR